MSVKFGHASSSEREGVGLSQGVPRAKKRRVLTDGACRRVLIVRLSFNFIALGSRVGWETLHTFDYFACVSGV